MLRWAVGGRGGAQRPVLHANKPKKTGAQCKGAVRGQNPLYIVAVYKYGYRNLIPDHSLKYCSILQLRKIWNRDRQRSTMIEVEGTIFSLDFSKKYDLSLLPTSGCVFDR